jgi:type IV secretory pathway VirB6-like protein
MNDHMLSCSTRKKTASAAVSAGSASQSSDANHSNMEPARKSLATISIDASRRHADSVGTESSSTTLANVQVNSQDIIGDFLGLTATTFSLSNNSGLKAIAPPLDVASNLYGASTAFGQVRNSDLGTDLAVIGAFANVGFGYASGVAAAAVATAVFETAVAFVAPPVAIAYAIGASATVLADSNFVNSYVNEVTHSVLRTTINTLSEQQSAAEHDMYEYSRNPFAGSF